MGSIIYSICDLYGPSKKGSQLAIYGPYVACQHSLSKMFKIRKYHTMTRVLLSRLNNMSSFDICCEICAASILKSFEIRV